MRHGCVLAKECLNNEEGVGASHCWITGFNLVPFSSNSRQAMALLETYVQ